MKCFEFQCFENVATLHYPQKSDNILVINGVINSEAYDGSIFTVAGDIIFNSNVCHLNTGEIRITADVYISQPIFINLFHRYVIINDKKISITSISSQDIQHKLNMVQLLKLQTELDYYDIETKIGYTVKNVLSHYKRDFLYSITNESIDYTCNVKNNISFFTDNNIDYIECLYIIYDWCIVTNKNLFFILFIDDDWCMLEINVKYTIPMLCGLCPTLLRYANNDILYIKNMKTFYIRCPDMQGLLLKCKIEIKN